jgi:peptidoglycan/xylan/chitin deacetylase (PgdA/CDA1 family)
MKILEIHQVDEGLFSLPLEDYVLTFDDGLYTQYKYIDKLAKLNTRKIFFISTNIVCRGEQSGEYISCEDAHDQFFRDGNAKHYMTWDQIREISKIPSCEIGAHSHFHRNIRNMDAREKLSFLVRDTELMGNAFMKEIGRKPTSFCFPYNYTEVIYNCILQKNGYTKFYGKERLSLDSFLEPI